MKQTNAETVETAGERIDERLLVSEITGGDKELFRIFVQRYEQKVFALGVSFFHNADDAADFTQDVFLKAFHSLKGFEGRSRFSTWLFKIAYNTAINAVNRKKEYRSLAEEDASAVERTEQNVMYKLTQNAVRTAVENLPAKYRVCVDLFFFYGRSYKEIEVITGFPVNTVKSHVFRAKKILRKKLADFQGEI
ncbi:MAG: sigma-70 family RNA polymerase sigma factor [Treponema sp.]|jgi:RNA polymerase sigma-70 factor (ECF subfamily)|nr:sigma-70 family RNA polymerase sigma factor [Treponema sp.]